MSKSISRSRSKPSPDALLAAFGREDQILLSGQLITLRPNAVQNLGMAFHELGTNSAKYGALSNDDGRVEVRWQVAMDGDGIPVFELTWDETFAPKAFEAASQTEPPHLSAVMISSNGTS